MIWAYARLVFLSVESSMCSSVPVRFGSRFLPVPRFMLARGRGGVQVLEHLGPESAENLYSPARPRQCRGIQIMCCLWEGTCFRYFFGEATSRVGGAGPRTRGSTGFGTCGA